MDKKLAYVGITSVFLSGAVIVALAVPEPRLPQGWQWALWGLAALRLGRLVAFDKVMEFERSLFGICTVKDGSGSGESTESRGDGVQGAIGDLLCCPTCAATWGTGVLLLLYQTIPTLATLLVAVLALTAVTDIGQALIEFLEGLGQAGREIAGDSRIKKEKDVVL